MTTAVAIALYNGEKFLEKQLDSIKKQTRMPDRLVMCDDGSKDRTVEIAEDYIRNNGLENSWSLHINEKNLGYIKNFYGAISLCDADLVFLCDQDDLWQESKIEKMSRIMEEREDINLLSCRYGIIDAEDKRMYGLMEKPIDETEEIREVSVQDIARAYHWPGMVMCIRKSFFDEIYEKISQCDVPHDLMFAVCAADRNSFYQYEYVGAFHRRHGNNTANEEHRVSKLLDLKRKMRDISVLQKQVSGIISDCAPLSEESKRVFEKKYKQLNDRYSALKERSLKGVIKLYTGEGRESMRLYSFLCDAWLVCFGDYDNI